MKNTVLPILDSYFNRIFLYCYLFIYFFEYLSASVAFLECNYRLQDIIVIDNPMVKFSFECSNPMVFGEI